MSNVAAVSTSSRLSVVLHALQQGLYGTFYLL